MDINPTRDPSTPQPQQLEPSPSAPNPIKPKHAHNFIFGYLVLIILVAAVAGVYAWQHKKVTTLNSQLSSLNTQVTNLNKQVASLQAAARKSSSTTTTTSQSMFKIPELGIELINVPSSISDLTYSVTTVSTTPTNTAAGFTTTTLVAKNSACSTSEGGGSIGNIDRITGTYNSSTDQGPFKFVKQFNGFWIDFVDNGIPCSQDSSIVNLQASQGKVFDSLVTNSSNVELIQ